MHKIYRSCTKVLLLIQPLCFKDFVERSHHVVTDLPHLKEDIQCRVQLLTAKWDILQLKDTGMHPSQTKHGYEIGGVKLSFML